MFVQRRCAALMIFCLALTSGCMHPGRSDAGLLLGESAAAKPDGETAAPQAAPGDNAARKEDEAYRAVQQHINNPALIAPAAGPRAPAPPEAVAASMQPVALPEEVGRSDVTPASYPPVMEWVSVTPSVDDVDSSAQIMQANVP